MKKSKKSNLKKSKINLITGILHIHVSFNNTIVTITDLHGNAFAWASAGSTGFRGARKSTPFAAQISVETAVLETLSKTNTLKNICIIIKGYGSGREAAIRSVKGTGVNILSIKDVTAIPHNGCRPPKRRRI
mmetsp:Transcript_27986/g.43058  ORF Transcript_27986/g.43058 Transcript_27986/m.43058 type:complete len:132 (+) Transcript_27986:626-1021(+)